LRQGIEGSSDASIHFYDKQVVDILTKSLCQLKFVYFRDKVGVVERERVDVVASTQGFFVGQGY